MWSLIVLAIIVVIAGALTYFGFFFYGVAVKRAPKSFVFHNAAMVDEEPSIVEASWAEGEEWISRQNLRKVEITSYDALTLNGYFIASDRAEGRTAIIAHGYSGKGKDMAICAKVYFEELGYNVLIPDARGHGDSGGNYIGFGWPERRDYLQWVNYIIEETGPDAQIVLHGVSMGGTTVLTTSGEELPPQVKASVADCAFSSVKAELSYHLRRIYRLPSFPFIPITSLITKIKAGYFFGEASALKQVRKAKVPILFIHGDADKFVPFTMMDELYDACCSPKEKYIVPEAGHGLAYDTDRVGYVSRVSHFVDQYVQ